jgi:hypothetical protein
MAAGFSTEIFKTYTSPVAKLGTPMEDPHGGRFRFAQNGAVALAAARLVQATVPVAAHVGMAVQAAQPAGSYTIAVTMGATAVVANEYADGYVYINDAGADVTTEGYMYRVKSHPAAAASGVLTLTLYEDTPVKIALTTNGKATLVHNRHYGTLIHPSPPTAPVVGVTRCAVPANAYYWAQTKGLCPVLTEGVIVASRSVQPSSTTDGAVAAILWTEGTPNVEIVRPVGYVEVVNATTEESLIFLTID